MRLARNLEAPFEVVISVGEMGFYKPRLGAFEYLFDKLGPGELVHVSASPMYDHRPASVMGIENKVYVDRGFGHDEHWHGDERLTGMRRPPRTPGTDAKGTPRRLPPQRRTGSLVGALRDLSPAGCSR